MERRGVPAAPGDAAVSSVVGTVLMLGITVAVFTGFSLFALGAFSESEEQDLRADLAVLDAGDRYLLQHRGGDALDLDRGRLLLHVDGVPVTLELRELASQTADGATWRIGESLCLSGPSPPCHYDHVDVGDLRVVYGNAIVLTGDAFAAGGPVTTFVSAVTPLTGTVSAFASMQSSVDGGAEAVLFEGSSSIPPGTAGPTKFSGAAVANTGAASPNNALASDDARVEFDASGDAIEVNGFDLPANVDAITALTIGYEGRKAGSGGTSPTVRIDYRIGTGAYSLGASFAEGSDADADRTRAVTGLTAAQVEQLGIRIQYVTDTNRNLQVDHVFARVTYTTLAQTTHSLDVVLAFASVPVAATHELQLDYRVAGDAFAVEVWDGSAYTPRGDALTAATATEWSYTLTAAEYNGGSPRLRIVDATPGGTTQGTVALDYVRMVSTA